MRSHASSLALAPLLALPIGVLAAQDLRLNGPLPSPRGGDLVEYHLTADGRKLVYLADQEEDERFELYLVSVATGGLDRRKLNGPLVAGGDVSPSLVLTPDESHLIYTADEEAVGLHGLYAVPLDGGAAVRIYSPTSASESVIPSSTRITSDSARVVFRTGPLFAPELFVAPVDGSAPAVRLSEPAAGRVLEFELTADGTQAVYSAGDAPQQLYSVPLDGSRAPLALLTRTLGTTRISAFELTADGTRVVLNANLRLESRFDLHVVGLDGGPVTELIRPSGTGNAGSFTLAGERVVYLGGPRQGRMEVFSMPIDGSAAAVQLSPAGRSVSTFTVAADGTRVALLAYSTQGASDLFVAPSDGATAAVQVNPPLVPFGTVYGGMQFSPDGARLVYQATQDDASQLELYSAPSDASAAPVKLNPPLPAGSQLSYGFALAADDGVVFKADATTRGVIELYSAPLLGGAAVKLNGPLVFGGDVAIDTFQVPDGAYRVSGDGRVVAYVADQEENNVLELYAGPTRGTFPFKKISLGMPIGPVEGDVSTHRLTPDGKRVVYLADQRVNDVLELFVVDADRSAEPRRVSAELVPGGGVRSFEISPDGARIVYRADAELDERIELYSVLLDGSSSPQRLNAPLGADGDVLDRLRFTPDGLRVVFAQQQAPGAPPELLSVPADGGGAPVLLSQGAVAGGGFTNNLNGPAFLVTPDSTRVLFLGDLATDEVTEVWSVPTDGSSAPLRVSGPLQPNGDAYGLQLAAGGARVLFFADAFVDRQAELFSAPVDGSAPALELDGALSLLFPPVLDASGQRAVLLARDTALVADQLFVVPVDGSAAPSALIASVPVATQIVDDLEVVGDTVLFRSRVAGRFAFQLFAAPLDGSSAPRRLSRPLPWNRDVIGEFADGARVFRATPDGRSVLFTAEEGASIELYVAPLDGSVGARRLSTPADDVVRGDFLPTPDGRSVLYRRDPGPGRMAEVFLVPLTGGAPRRIGGPEPLLVRGFLLSPDGRRLVKYAEDPRELGVLELFLSFLPPSGLLPR